MKRALAGVALIAAFLTTIAGPAGAAVVSTTGALVSATPPASIADQQYTSNTEIRVLTERRVQITASLTIAEVWTPTGKVTKTFDANVCLQSHLVHYDRASGDGRLAGSVTFAKPIQAVLPFVPGLTVTDPLFQLPGVTYPGIDLLRGFEPVAAAGETDTITQPDATTLGVDLFERSTVLLTDSKMDQIRVLTDCDDPTPVIPEAGTTILLSVSAVAALAAAVVVTERRRHARLA